MSGVCCIDHDQFGFFTIQYNAVSLDNYNLDLQYNTIMLQSRLWQCMSGVCCIDHGQFGFFTIQYNAVSLDNYNLVSYNAVYFNTIQFFAGRLCYFSQF
jgi:nitrogen regulatory protein PII-like uncharacterized protein